jgi:hypothetical protein
VEKQPDFDVSQAHRFFSAECFNLAWNLIDKPVRTPDEDQQMLQLGMASLWHWSQRPDRSPVNLSVGHWQLARIYALLGQAEAARTHAEQALALSREAGDYPFYQAYAYEALARAAVVAGDKPKVKEYLKAARELAGRVPDPDDKQLLEADLATIE